MRRFKDVVTRVGNPVGSQLFELDPVTTDRPSGREIAVSGLEPNLRARSDAGPWQNCREFLSAYISGYVDGEGCFTVSISPRAKLLVGWEVRPSFSVSQNADRAQLLFEIRARWGCGFIRPDRSDSTLKFEVRNVRERSRTATGSNRWSPPGATGAPRVIPRVRSSFRRSP